MQLTTRVNTAELHAGINQATQQFGDWAPMWREARPLWAQTRRQMFETHGRSAGTPWAEYADTDEGDAYVYAKAAILGMRVSDVRELVEEWPGGPQRASLEGDGTFSVFDVGPDRVQMGTAAPGANTTAQPPEWTQIDRRIDRPLAGLGDPMSVGLAELLQDHMASVLASAGVLSRGVADTAGRLVAT